MALNDPLLGSKQEEETDRLLGSEKVSHTEKITQTEPILGSGKDYYFDLSEDWKNRYIRRAKAVDYEERLLMRYVKAELWKALSPHQQVSKKEQFSSFLGHAVAGLLVPIALPAVLTYESTKEFIRQLCAVVGLIGTDRGASGREAGKVVLDDLIALILIDVLVEEAIPIPVVGAAISAVRLPSRREKIVWGFFGKAIQLHQMWIRANIPLLSLCDCYQDQTCKAESFNIMQSFCNAKDASCKAAMNLFTSAESNAKSFFSSAETNAKRFFFKSETDTKGDHYFKQPVEYTKAEVGAEFKPKSAAISCARSEPGTESTCRVESDMEWTGSETKSSIKNNHVTQSLVEDAEPEPGAKAESIEEDWTLI